MATNNVGDFPLPKDGYLCFDAKGLKAFLKQRLIENGVWTDSAYEGSNISQLIDLLSYTFNTLIYYLNRTSTNATFSDTTTYEDINRLVKLINYNPIGRQSAILTFGASAQAAMPTGLYTIPRYSYVNLGAVSYSFNEDVTFFKSTSSNEFLEDFSSSKLFYQGRYIENPIYTATGDENELIFLNPGDNVIIDHFNIDVYVKSIEDGKYTKWVRTPSLYTETSNDKKYEIRLNESKHYEIKFGNNINGKKLQTGDQVAIYYLKSNGTAGEVGVNALQAGKLIKYTTNQFNQIFNDVIIEDVTIIPDNELINLKFDNESSSTYSASEENVEQIKQNSPSLFRSQYRLVTETDFENYVKTNFSNLIHDVKVVNNWSYLSDYLKYFYDIGITDPNNVGRVLFNQVNFADSCNFNNVYLFIVSKAVSDAANQGSLLNPTLKSLIISSMKDVKLLTCEPVTVDPVFMSFDLAMAKTGISPTVDDAGKTELYVVKTANSKRDSSAIQTDINNIFINYFDRANCALGQTIDINYLSNSILSVNGVDTFYTRRTDDNNVKYEGLSMLTWNPIYRSDMKLITQNLTQLFFQFPILNNRDNFINKINVVSTMTQYQDIEY
jgi:hypothetical protein